MKLDLAAVMAEAWAMMRRDAGVLVGIVGPLLFLPRFALLLLIPLPPLPATQLEPGSREANEAGMALIVWAGTNGIWLVVAAVLGSLGVLATMLLYLDRDGPDVGAALARAGRLWPRFCLLLLIATPPLMAGLLLFTLPGLFIIARLMLAGPALVAERPLAAGSALGRGWRLSSGASLPLTAAVGATMGVGWLLTHLLAQLAAWLAAQPGGENPVALATVDAVEAAIGTAASLALTLVAIASYRRLASRGI